MSLNIFLTQEAAEQFFRSKFNNISEVSLIQDTSASQPINGRVAWFCKSGGEKFISRFKGQIEAFGETDFPKNFRVIERGFGFIINEQLYSFGHKGRIGHSRIIDSSQSLRNACDSRLLKKYHLIEKFYRVKCIDSEIVINYFFGLFERNSKFPIVKCVAFQEEANFFDPEHHVIEIVKPGEHFEFMGGKYYSYSLNNWDMLIAPEPK